MNIQNDSASQDKEVRRRVEERVNKLKPLAEEISLAQALSLIRQLQVRQVELEIQNEELRRSQLYLDESEKALREVTNKLEALFRAAPLAIIALDLAGQVTTWNPAAERLFGWRAEEVLGRIPPSVPDDKQPELRAMLARAGQGESLVGIETQRYRKDGSVIDIRISTAPLYDVSGKVVGNIGMVEDITERQQVEEALRTQAQVLENMAEGVAVTDLRGIMVYTNPAFDAMFGYQAGELVGEHASLLSNHPPEDNLHITREILKALQTHGTWFGELNNRKKDGTPFLTSVRLSLVEAAGKRLYISVQEDITARKKMEAALNESQRILETLMEHIPEGITIAEAPDITIRMVSKYGQQLVGLAPENIFGGIPVQDHVKTWGIFRANGVTPATNEELPLTRATQHGEIVRNEELVIQTPRGEKITVLCNAGPIRDQEGKITGGVIAWRDIDDLKRAEAALKEATERLRALFLASPLAIVALDRDHRVMSWNPAAERLFGWSAGEVLGQPLPSGPEDEGEGLQEMMQQSLIGQEFEGHEVRCQKRDGSFVEVRLFTGPLMDSNGKIIGSVGILEDITELKRTAADLARSQADFEAIFNSISDAVAFANLQRQLVRVNPAFQTLFGYDLEEAIGQSTAIFYASQIDYEEQGRLRYHPEAQRRPLVFEVEYRRKDGSTFPAETMGTPVRDAQGNILGFVGVHRDITERRRAEEIIRRSHEELEQLVAERTTELRQALEHLQWEIEERRQAEEKVKEQSRLLEAFFQHNITPLVFLDRDFNFIRVNKAYARSCQRDVSEFIGRNHFDLYPHVENERIFAEVVRTKITYQAVAKPFIFPDHPEWGETYWDWNLIPILDENREVDFLVFSLKDVTARRRAELELARQNAILTGINRIFRETLTCETDEELGRACLAVLEELTESKFSFFDELEASGQLDFLAVSDRAWSSCKLSSERFRLPRHREVRGLYRSVIQDGQALIANAPVAHPDYRGGPAGHPELTAFLGVPLKHAGRIIGQIGLGNKPGGYDRADQETVEILALAIVEALVRKRAQDALKISEKKLRYLATRLLNAQEDERKRICTELHDELGHALLTFKLHLMTMEKKFLPEQENLAEDLKAVLDYMDEVIENVRRLYLDLSPGDLEDLGLTTALRSMIDDFIKNNQLDSSVQMDNIDHLFSQPAQTTIYRVIQEILTNIGKHADPTALSAIIRKEKDRVFFAFEDNGKGFEVGQTLTMKGKGLGLMTMAERVHMLGGSLKIDSQKNVGTGITFSIPTERGKHH